MLPEAYGALLDASWSALGGLWSPKKLAWWPLGLKIASRAPQGDRQEIKGGGPFIFRWPWPWGAPLSKINDY